MDGFESSIVINRPTGEVFAFLADLENDAKWRREWVAATKVSDGPIGVGTRFRLIGKFLAWENATEYVATEYEPDRTAAWKAVSGPLPLIFRRTFEGVEGATRVTIRYEGEMRGLLGLVRPVLVGMGRRQLRGDFPILKRLMETGTS